MKLLKYLYCLGSMFSAGVWSDVKSTLRVGVVTAGCVLAYGVVLAFVG